MSPRTKCWGLDRLSPTKSALMQLYASLLSTDTVDVSQALYAIIHSFVDNTRFNSALHSQSHNNDHCRIPAVHYRWTVGVW